MYLVSKDIGIPEADAHLDSIKTETHKRKCVQCGSFVNRGGSCHIPDLFAPYMGENSVSVPREYEHHGAFFPDWHIALPLTEDLWDDIRHRLHAHYLQVFHSEETHKRQHGVYSPMTVIIILDEDNLVRSIGWEGWYS